MADMTASEISVFLWECCLMAAYNEDHRPVSVRTAASINQKSEAGR